MVVCSEHVTEHRHPGLSEAGLGWVAGGGGGGMSGLPDLGIQWGFLEASSCHPDQLCHILTSPVRRGHLGNS